MSVKGNEAPDGWWRGEKEVKKKCPGSSNSQVRKALKQFNGDVEKTVTHLNSSNAGGRNTPAASNDPPPPQGIPQPTKTGKAEKTEKAEKAKQDDPLKWLNQLPQLPRPMSPLIAAFDDHGFDLRKLIGAIQVGVLPELVRGYLAYYHEDDAKQLEDDINQIVEGFPAIFYVADTNNHKLLCYWIKYGGNPNVSYGILKFPLIAFAILRGDRPRTKSAEILRTLLTFGALPDVIPAAYYRPFNKELPKSGPADSDLIDIQDDNKLWCKPAIRPLLASAMSLMQRYLLYLASRVDPSSGRERALMHRRDAEALLGLHLLIIGQEMGVKLLRRRLLIHLAMPSEKPLVLLFAGPSGHGKTELARKFKDLMALDFLPVDCTMYTHENEMFGPKPPYVGSENGSPLNNFLTRYSGNKCVVFLDEFEKTTTSVWNTLLIPFDQGEYMDRRNSLKVNCVETIWILATNKFDDTIHEFCKTNKRALLNNQTATLQSLIKQLTTQLRKECMSHFGAPLTGRITEIIPFLTFSPDEAAVVANKSIMELEAEVLRPVKLPETKKGDILVGNVQLDVSSDPAVCSKISNDYYAPELGARSIHGGVGEAISKSLVEQYLQDGDSFAEDQKKTQFTVGINAEKEVEVRLVSGNT
ncbi:hypothetical protein M426DRAFT_317339 [Hypoxylon sp. CI-4A]|nr:hypothetical protein M426DRAFT_317339 [Hypoxylon sp. CI-4A]